MVSNVEAVYFHFSFVLFLFLLLICVKQMAGDRSRPPLDVAKCNLARYSSSSSAVKRISISNNIERKDEIKYPEHINSGNGIVGRSVRCWHKGRKVAGWRSCQATW